MKRRISDFIGRWIVAWNVLALLTYLVLLVMTVVAWPANEKTIQITVLVSGIFTGMGALASVLKADVTEDKVERKTDARQ